MAVFFGNLVVDFFSYSSIIGTMNKLPLALIAMLPMTAHAGQLPLSAPVKDQFAYTTLADAEHAAIDALLSCGDHIYECGLAIYQDSTGFHYTAPVSQHEQGEVDYRVALPKGATLSALMHTHTGSGVERQATLLSDSDRKLAKTLNVPVIAYAVDFNKLVTK